MHYLFGLFGLIAFSLLSNHACVSASPRKEPVYVPYGSENKPLFLPTVTGPDGCNVTIPVITLTPAQHDVFQRNFTRRYGGTRNVTLDHFGDDVLQNTTKIKDRVERARAKAIQDVLTEVVVGWDDPVLDRALVIDFRLNEFDEWNITLAKSEPHRFFIAVGSQKTKRDFTQDLYDSTVAMGYRVALDCFSWGDTFQYSPIGCVFPAGGLNPYSESVEYIPQRGEPTR